MSHRGWRYPYSAYTSFPQTPQPAQLLLSEGRLASDSSGSTSSGSSDYPAGPMDLDEIRHVPLRRQTSFYNGRRRHMNATDDSLPENPTCDRCNQDLRGISQSRHDLEGCSAIPVPRRPEEAMAGPFSPYLSPTQSYPVRLAYPPPQGAWCPPPSCWIPLSASSTAGSASVARITSLPRDSPQSYVDWDDAASRAGMWPPVSRELVGCGADTYAGSSYSYTGTMCTPPGLSRSDPVPFLERSAPSSDNSRAFDHYAVGEPGPSQPLARTRVSRNSESSAGNRPVDRESDLN
jgi:hypothetical protein